MNLRPLLPLGVAYLMLTFTIAPAVAAAKAPSPKSGKTVPTSGGSGSTNPSSTGKTTTPHHDQGPVNLPPY